MANKETIIDAEFREVPAEVEKPTDEQAKEMTPGEYFEYVKSRKNTITDEELLNTYDMTLTMLKKYMVTGQKKACKKLVFMLDCIELERKVVQAGYNKFVYRWDIEKYIEETRKGEICIIEVENYERDIPDDVIDKIVDAKEIFSNLYILFTDYTRKESKKIAKERREKDPIIFGSIESDDRILDRLYYIADWVDENCDLTLEGLIKRYKDENKGNSPVRTINTPKDLEEMKIKLGLLKEEDAKYIVKGDED